MRFKILLRQANKLIEDVIKETEDLERQMILILRFLVCGQVDTTVKVNTLAERIKRVEQNIFLYLIKRLLVKSGFRSLLFFSQLFESTLHTHLRLMQHLYDDFFEEAQV